MPNNKMERFTPRARRVMGLAQEEAEQRLHSQIGTEHLLLGLIREEGGVGGRVLRDLKLELPRVEKLVAELSSASIRSKDTALELSPHLKHVLELAVDEARRMGHHYMGTEHLLLAMVREIGNTATEILTRCNITPAEVRRQTRRVLQESPLVCSPPVFVERPPTPKTERFSQGARRVLALAREAAEQLQHTYIGTEHVLLGIMREEDGVAGRVLRDLGLELPRIEKLVEELSRASRGAKNDLPDLSIGVKRVLELAVDEARRMGHLAIGTEHLLLGLVRQSEGVAIDILKRLGVSPEEVRRQTRRVIQENPPVGSSPAAFVEVPPLAQVKAAKNPTLQLTVTDTQTGTVKFDLTLPLDQVEAILDSVYDMIDEGENGKAIVEDKDRAQRIEIILKSDPEQSESGEGDAT